ncbi:MAG: 2-oxo acid dehydrogenase subunit E2 [Novosphingobium sp.]|nr:2-oxo acid dehydrogenase subunit E2 [Novosphingobium sp.]
MTRYQFKLSDIGEGIAEAELVEWLVNVGDIVREDQPVAAFMTDKATVELETPVSGTVVERTGEIGEAIRVGATILEIEIEGNGADAEKSEPFASSEVERRAEENVSRLRSTRAELLTPSPRPAPPPPAPPSSGKVLASPLVRRRAHDLGLDLASVPHSGPRVLNKDLEAFLVAPREEAAPTTTLIDAEVPVVGLRRAIARKMEEAKRRIPHFTYVEEIDMTAFEAQRATLNAHRADKLSALPFLIMAICRTLTDYPQLNAHYYDDKDVVRRFGAVNMGVATQTDNGLMVPVVHNADAMDASELARRIAALAAGARSGKIAREDLQGSSITITSLGKLGGIASTPILNAPEVCIIGPNKIVERTAVIDGMIAVRKIMNLSISCDHRVVDGYDAAAFVQALKQRLEMPGQIFAQT